MSQDLTATAEDASNAALREILISLSEHRHFRLEAGAGAGKTYSLIKSLQHILENRGRYLPRRDQKVACLTYTNVARDEIVKRTDADPSIFADTLHGFLWEMIRPYQKALREFILESDRWAEILEGRTTLDGIAIEYGIGFRGDDGRVLTLHHDDIPVLAIELFQMPKFRALIADRFPIILIDEYQDTPDGLVEAMLGDVDALGATPIFGFFGDHWQQIYDKSSGPIEHAMVTPIAKHSNFRSDTAIVNFLNQLRPELPQSPAVDAQTGMVTIYHTNQWPGQRLKSHNKGQISQEAAHATLTWLTGNLEDFWAVQSGHIKTLMLTHATIANELGYSSLPRVFRYNEAFAKKADPVVAFLVDTVEPAVDAFANRRYGQLFKVVGGSHPNLRAHGDKVAWSAFFDQLSNKCLGGAVGDVLDHILDQSLFPVPAAVRKRQAALERAVEENGLDEEIKEPRILSEYQRFRNVRYSEVRALASYVDGHTTFSTKHNVKGAEFDNVIVVVGRGWSIYDFAKMLGSHLNPTQLDDRGMAAYVRARNLFYVAVSRARHNLAVLFTQELDSTALLTLAELVEPSQIVAIGYTDETTPVGHIDERTRGQ
ncbi:UvrD-helicase domain-containing protein [Nocardia nova]|uniref:UvrD-helicase domain-containing protein n=1 Tax=Nocardia nova TaxID=37330 RepID=UPI0033E7371A